MFARNRPSSSDVEESQLQRLVERAVESDAGYQQLWRVLEPRLQAMVTQPRFASHLAHSEASRRRIIAAIKTQLSVDRLQLFVDRCVDGRHPHKTFSRWLRTMAKRIAMSARYDEPQLVIRRRPSVAVRLRTESSPL
jgi:hypothetical protein